MGEVTMKNKLINKIDESYYSACSEAKERRPGADHY